MSGAPARRAELEAIFREALTAVDARALLERALHRDTAGLAIAGRRLPAEARLCVLAVGKAALPMLAALEAVAGDALAGGLAVAPGRAADGAARTRVVESAHPVPDERSEAAGREALALVENAAPEDVLVVLLSGGASSLLACPAAGLRLADLAGTTRVLLEAGADIEELNAVRKHLSALAGGRLALGAAARRIEVLLISDVPDDRLDVIGSGPFSADPTHFGDALRVLETRGVRELIPEAALRHLEAGARGECDETAKPGDPALERVRTTVLASNRSAVEAAVEAARRRGLAARVLAQPLAGEAREEGRRLAELAQAASGSEPMLLAAGGETVVTVKGPGRGGRNQELALAAALALDGRGPAALLCAGTDGVDGPTAAAGAYADEGTVERGRRAGADARAALEANDSNGFFAAEGGVFTTGPTGTNVMDLALVRSGRV